MADDPTLQPEELSEETTGYLPFDDDAGEGEIMPRGVSAEEFLYIGRGLTADEFSDYVRDYDFGTIPPDFVVLHHTAIPSASWAPYPTGSRWDAGDGGLPPEQIKQRRLKKLNAIKEFYRVDRGWDRGPHLFVDDRFIWLFTPMRETGIHAKQGNSYRDAGGLHYSIGIEVIGYFEDVQWPEPVAQLVGHTVAVLHRRLGTFELRYGRNAGALSSHRDYNKPACPGKAITEQYYVDVIKAVDQRLTSASVTLSVAAVHPLTLDSPLLGPPSGGLEQTVDYVETRLPAGSEYKHDVRTIMGYYWKYAPMVGVDPFLAAVQCIHETDALCSYWAGRPRRNPAGLGVRSRDVGLSFATWEDGVRAHLAQLLAFALTDEAAGEAQREMMRRNPGHNLIAPSARGAAPVLRALSGRWTDDDSYAEKIVARARAIVGS